MNLEEMQKVFDTALNQAEELMKLGAFSEATLLIDQILKVDPKDQRALQLHGLLLYRNGKYKEAVDVFEKALEDANNADNCNNLALCHLHSAQYQAAQNRINQALELQPNNHHFLNNCGMILRASNLPDLAIEQLWKSIEIEPNDAKTWINLGAAYGQNKQLDEAIRAFRKALELDPQEIGAHIDLAHAYHLKGEWVKGWKHYEHRLEFWNKSGRHSGKFLDIYKPEKNWNGVDSLEGKTVVLYCEQGMGDYIQFIRFAPLLKNMGAKLIIDATPDLASLFEDFGTIRSSYNGEEYDYHCSVLSLPYLLKLSNRNFLGSKPYLRAKKNYDMSDYQDVFRIGIVWAGNPAHPNDALRSTYLKYFKGISEIEGVKLFSFQKDTRKRIYATMPGVEVDFAAGAEDVPIVDLTDKLTDYQETANLLNQMDYVISVDTSIMHLAAALGKPTAGLIAYNPCWRWQLDGSDTPWYIWLRLFRQQHPQSWTEVFEEVEYALKSMDLKTLVEIRKKNENILPN